MGKWVKITKENVADLKDGDKIKFNNYGEQTITEISDHDVRLGSFSNGNHSERFFFIDKYADVHVWRMDKLMDVDHFPIKDKGFRLFNKAVFDTAHPYDYTINKKYLPTIKPELRSTYLLLIKRGVYIFPALKALEIIELISIETSMKPDVCVNQLDNYKILMLRISERPRMAIP